MIMDNEQPHQELVKCVVVGDTAVGKTRLICARACDTQVSLGQLINTHIPTVWAIDQYRIYKEVLERSREIVDGVDVSLRLWDTFGDHDKDRRFAYGRSDVVVLCFSLANPVSLRNCKVMWYPEIRKFCPHTPIILVGCKNDLRYMYMDEKFISYCKDRSPFVRQIRECDILTPDQGRAVAREIGAPYYETSVLTTYGVHEVFENVIRAALIDRRKQRFWMANLKKVQRPLVQLPFCPPKPPSPDIAVPNSMFDEDLYNLLQTQCHTDVIFTVGSVGFPAHKFLLSAASPVMRKLLTMDLSADLNMTRSSSDSSMMSTSTFGDSSLGNFNPDTENLILEDSSTGKTWEQPATGRSRSTCLPCAPHAEKLGVYKELSHPAYLAIHLQQCESLDAKGRVISSMQTVITMSRTISTSAMQLCLRFLYTGMLEVRSCNLDDLHRAAQLMELSELQVFIANILTREEFLNVELQQQYKRNLTQNLKSLCLDGGLFSDVLFQLDDGTRATHRPMLMCRCDVMYAMFSGDFRESMAKKVQFPGVRMEVFYKLLIYLYTDNCPQVSLADCVEVLGLANRLCLPRLISLLEKQILFELTKIIVTGGDITETTIHLLEACQMHNADQLADWCMNHIAINYNEICKKTPKLLRNLHPENQAYLNRHRWPPIWYLKEYDYYERCMMDREREEKPLKMLKRHRNNSGCLCFSIIYKKNVLWTANRGGLKPLVMAYILFYTNEKFDFLFVLIEFIITPQVTCTYEASRLHKLSLFMKPFLKKEICIVHQLLIIILKPISYGGNDVEKSLSIGHLGGKMAAAVRLRPATEICLVLLLLLIASSSSSNKDDQSSSEFKRYQLTHPFMLHGRSKRDVYTLTQGGHLDEVKVGFDAFGKTFLLNLHQN
uniref:BTB domain-containing protein n=1 Tax=Strigamia maritima TaxID=126957 RepID=T1JMP0_STRMM